jgi:hypothetical protein
VPGALALGGFVRRGTFDVDIIARAEESDRGLILIQAEPIPVVLRNAICFGESLAVIAGTLPPRTPGLVSELGSLRQGELLAA